MLPYKWLHVPAYSYTNAGFWRASLLARYLTGKGLLQLRSAGPELFTIVAKHLKVCWVQLLMTNMAA